MKKKVNDMYKSGKGYKAISKALGFSKTQWEPFYTREKNLGIVVNLFSSGRHTKITPTALQRLIQEEKNSINMRDPGHPEMLWSDPKWVVYAW